MNFISTAQNHTSLPQGASQSVPHKTPSVLRPTFQRSKSVDELPGSAKTGRTCTTRTLHHGDQKDDRLTTHSHKMQNTKRQFTQRETKRQKLSLSLLEDKDPRHLEEDRESKKRREEEKAKTGKEINDVYF